jgi:hypothetical protein
MGKDVVVRARVFAMGMKPAQEEIVGLLPLDPLPEVPASPPRAMTVQEMIEDIRQAFRDHNAQVKKIYEDYEKGKR